MDFIKECVRLLGGNDSRSKFFTELSAARDNTAKIDVLDRYLCMLNITKTSVRDLSWEETLRLSYLLQELGIDFGLCEYLRVFYSGRNAKMHTICEATRGRIRATCMGRTQKCTHHFFDSSGSPSHEPEAEPPERKWKQL